MTNTRPTFTFHHAAAALAALFVILGVVYSVVSPIFEVSDEFLHYPVVRHIATTGTLPVQQPGTRTLWDQEGSQPPLYYLAGAALTFWINTDDLEDVRWRNPHGKLGIPLDPDNRNIIIHTGAEAFPWHGTVLAVHLIRFLSVALGAGSVVLAYRIAHEVWPERPWVSLLAAALVTFNPMFLFISGSVNNDNLMIFLATWTLLLVVRVLQSGITTQRALTLAVVIALGTLTKISGLTLLPVVGLALIIHGVRRREWRPVVLTAAAIGLAWAVLAGWWYLRNIQLYGELLGTQTMIAVAGPRVAPITLWELRREWYGFWVAYWALFGGVSILADPIIYRFYATISWIALAGLGWWLFQTIRRRAWRDLLIPGLLALQVAITFAGVVQWTLQTYGSQGRLMFPVIAAISALLALGLLNWLPGRWQAPAAGVVGLPLLVIAAIIPFRTIAPVYAPPPVIDSVPANATPVGLRFGGLEIVAVRTESVSVEAGGRVPVTLYLRANEPLDTNYSLYLHALGRHAGDAPVQIGKIDTYPGGGTLPSSFMEPGVIYADRYSIELDDTLDAPTLIRINIGAGLSSPGQYVILDGTMPDGSVRRSVIVEAGVAYPAGFAGCEDVFPPQPGVSAALGDFARLAANPVTGRYAPGDSVPVTLYWDRLADTPVNWTVFVHLLDSAGAVAAQADGPPLNGDYPTAWWRAACEVADQHTLVLPADLAPGEYSIAVGLYDAQDPSYVRAPALLPDGSPYPNYAVPVGVIQVEAP